MKIVTVIPLRKGIFSDDLTYFSAKEVKKGDIVKISIRGKEILGLVVSAQDASNQKSGIKEMSYNLKKILEVKGTSLWRKEFLNAIHVTADYFTSGIGQSAVSLIPTVFRENYDTLTKFIPNDRATMDAPTDSSPAIKTEKLLFQAPYEDRLAYYKTLIRGSFAEKKSVFFVLPTERDVETFSSVLSKGIDQFSFSFHGNMTKKKVLDQFRKMVSSPHPVIIFGTAPYLSIPRNDLKIIIVEHESSPAHKMQARPYIDLRIFAEVFAESIGAKFILSDSMLRFETYAKKGTSSWAEVQSLSFRTDFKGRIIISGKYEEGTRNKKFKVLGDESIEKITETIRSGKNVFIFSLRKGLATYTICRDCSESILCESCSSPITLYVSKSGKRLFSCNRCRSEKDPDTHCKNCMSWNLAPLGIGTETVYEEAKRLFKDVKIFRMDKESVKTSKQASKMVKEFESSKGAIMIGTELALFYLEEKVKLSVIASFDSLWSIPNFRMSEKVVQLLSSIVSKTTATVCIETRNENDPGILALKNDTLLQFVKGELRERENLGYPPFKRFIKVSHTGNKEETIKAKEILSNILLEYQPDIYSAFIPKAKDKYVTHALIRLSREKWSLPELLDGSSLDHNLLSRLRSLSPSFSINVDPEDLL